eukprot:5161204-Amphidinium_carterae.1
MHTQSNGRSKAEGPGQDSADFHDASKEAAWYSQPSAETHHPTAERTQRWAWTAGKHRKQIKGLSLMAVWVAVNLNMLQAPRTTGPGWTGSGGHLWIGR